MTEVLIEKLNEKVYVNKLKNGFTIILYPTKKSKNFYVTLSTKFGAKILKYVKNNKEVNVIPGTAHFLEHKVMDINDKKILGEVEKLGSYVNAYTNYYGTTYNIYGSKDILKNIEILFKRVFTFNLTDKSVENEKDIITQEINMVFDRPGSVLFRKSNNNLFHNDYLINHVLGDKEDINKITKEYLYEIYNDFYTPENMFCVVTGNFNKDEVDSYIESLVNDLNVRNTSEITIPKIKEPNDVKISFEEKNMNVVYDKLSISYKMPYKNFKKIEKRIIKNYINLYLSIKLDSTSNFYNECKNEELVIGGINYIVNRCGDYLLIHVNVPNCKNSNEFIDKFNKEIVKTNVKEEDFNRKKKVMLSSYILSYEDIEQVNDSLTLQYLNYGDVLNNIYNEINKLNYNEFKEIIGKIDFENKSIVILHK